MSDNQVSFATLGNAVGFVVQITGTVRVQSIDGQERVIKAGDPIFYGETVIAVGNGSATIEFTDGNQVVVANEAVVEITEEVFSFGDGQELVADSSAEFDELQQAILDGQDPTQIQDAPAAGDSTINDGDDTVDVNIDRSNKQALPEYGYDTDNSREVSTGGSSFYGREVAPDPFAFVEQRSVTNTDSSSTPSETGSASSSAPSAPNVTIKDATTDGQVNVTISLEDTGAVEGDTLTVNGREIVLTADDIAAGQIDTTVDAPAEGETLTVEATITDSSGNVSNPGTDSTDLDVTAPSAPGVTIKDSTADGQVNVTISLEDTGAVEGDTLTVNGKEIVLTADDIAAGQVDTTVDAPAEGETLVVEATITDSSGNVSNPGTDSTDQDVTAPSAPSVIITEDVNKDGFINAAELDGQVNVTISLTDTGAVEGDTLTVNGSEIELTASHISAGEVLTTVDAPVEGSTVTVEASITDAAGNSSANGSDSAVLDTTATAGVVTVDAITTDDVINAAEASGAVVVTGSAIGGDIAEGDAVTMTINGNVYDTTVDASGNWSVDVAGSDLAADTAFDAVVNSVDDVGNTVRSIGSSVHGVDSSPLVINLDIDPITDDSILNAAEASGTVTVTGSVSGDQFDSGSIILTVNGKTYPGQLDGRNFSIEVDGSDLAADIDSLVEGAVTVENAIGQTGQSVSTESYFVDTAARATIRVDSITSDDVVSAAEAQTTITVSGRVGFDAQAGDVVSFEVNGSSYQATVQANKTWSVDVLGADLAADTSFVASVSGTDNAGNPYFASANSTHTVDLVATAGTVTIDAITPDDEISAAEAAGTVTVTGTATGGDIKSGDQVALEINGKIYTTTVDANDEWSVDVAGSDLAADTAFDAVVSSKDSVGNTVKSVGSSTHSVDLTIDTTTVTLTTSDVNEDAASVTFTATLSNAAETEVTITTDQGDIVIAAGETTGTLVVDTQDSDVYVDASSITATVSAVDGGNFEAVDFSSATATAQITDTIDTTTVTLTTSDVNEDAASVTFTATLSNAAETEVTITTDQGDIVIAAGETTGTLVVDFGSDEILAGSITATVTDVFGGNYENVDFESANATAQIFDITAPNAPGVTISEDYNNDGLISASELDALINVTISLTDTNAVEGDTLTVNGAEIELTAAHITAGEVLVTVDVPQEGETLTVEASITDIAGNKSDKGYDSAVLDTEATAGTVTVNAITSDDVINASEAAGTVAVSGTATGGDIAEGDTVTLEINGETYTTTVDANGEWSVDVAGSDLAADTAFDAVVSSEDAAGNTVESTGSSTHTVDTEATAGTVTVNAITSDDVINASEAAGTVAVSGTATGGDIAEGDTVTLEINGETYTTTVDANGEWSVDVAGSDLAADTAFDAVVSSEDAAGNTVESKVTSTHSVDVTAYANIDVDRITSDSIINSSESAEGVIVNVTGWVSGEAQPGDTVTIYLEGQAIGEAAVSTDQDSSGRYLFSVPVEGSVLAATNLANPFLTGTVTGTDEVGNSFSSSNTEIYKVDLFADVDAFVEEANYDGIVNFDEQGNVIVGGWIEQGGDVTSITIQDENGDEITITENVNIEDDGSGYYYFEASVDVSELGDGTLTVVVDVVDESGNPGQSEQMTVEKDTQVAPPVITNITDDSSASDYSTVTLHGTGEAGALITLWVLPDSTTAGNDTQTTDVYQELTEVTTTVSSSGTWSLDVSNLGDVPVNDNEFFKVTQTDTAGNTSEFSNTAHYWHGEWANIATEQGDDYVLTGSGNDQIRVSVDDTNDALTIDGGAGTDTVVFQNFDASQATFVLQENGNLQITRGDTGDVVLLIDVENVKIDGVTYTLDQLFTPTVVITEDANNDGIVSGSELEGNLNIRVDLPLGAQAGDMVTISTDDGDGSLNVLVTEQHIADGSLTAVIDVDTSNGSELEVSAKLSTGTQSSSDNVTFDTTASAEGEQVAMDEDAQPLVIDVLANDEAGATLVSGSVSVDETKGSVTVNEDGTITFTPALNFVGQAEITYQIQDEFGNVGSATATVSVAAVNDKPELVLSDSDVSVNEDGLVNGGTDTVVTGAFTFSDVDTSVTDLNVTLVAPQASMTSGGEPITWTTVDGALVGTADGETVVRVELTSVDAGQGEYTVTLLGPVDHAGSNDASLSFDFGVTVSDGSLTDTQNVSVTVVDDAPQSAATSDTVDITSTAASSFSVVGIAGGFANNVYSDGTNQTHENELDEDSLIDQVTWTDEDGSSNKTSLTLADSDPQSTLSMSDTFTVGTFTHVNTAISSSYKSLETSKVTYELTVNIAGQDVAVTLTADLEHDATSNSSEPSADIVRLTNLSSEEVTVKGSTYTVSLAGFVDEAGNIATNLSTEEGETSVVSLAAKVEVSSVAYGAVMGNVTLASDVGADGGVIVAETITTDDGSLVINSDGTYEFTPSSAFATSIEPGQSDEAIFTYQVRDADGDVVNNQLTITVNAENSAPVATDDNIPTFAGLSGEYFGLNQQISNLETFKSLIADKEADATFIGADIDYQRGSGDVGEGTHLQDFLGDDASTLSNDPVTTSDGGIRLSGYVYLEAGTYNFKVYADDGYQISVDGNAVATVANNQSPRSTEHDSFVVTESGYHSIEMLWWDQGGDYVFQPELSADGGETYFKLDSSILTSNLIDGVVAEAGQAVVIDAEVLLANDTDADSDTLSITSVDNVENGYAYLNVDGNVVFVPNAGYTGEASFDYIVSDGQGGIDTATATLNVSGSNDTASVTVSVTGIIGNWDGFGSKAEVVDNATYDVENYDQWHQFDGSDDLIDISNDVKASLQTGSGDDSVYVGHDLHKNGDISTGSGNDSVYIDNDVKASLQTGDGDDSVHVDDDLKSEGYISTGSGNDKVFIKDEVQATLDLGSGNDTATIGKLKDGGHINLGSGNDSLFVSGNVDDASIDAGSGNDYVVISGKIDDDSWFQGGEGTDSIVFESYTYQDYLDNEDGIKWNIGGFENIKFSDGHVIGDASAFNTTGAVAGYAVAVSIANLATDESVSSVVIDGVPAGAKLQQAGADLTQNEDGSYTVTVSEGATSISDLTVVSTSGGEVGEFNLTASISTDGVNDELMGTSDEEAIVGSSNDDFLSGTSGEDNLLGNVGDDVLFGGDDESVDVLVGGAGKDIFILDNDNDLSDGFTQDIIMDFDASEDALDISDLLDLPSDTNSEDQDAVKAFLEANVSLTEDEEGVKHLSIGEEGSEQEVATFGADSAVAADDTISVIFNNQEYNINMDG
ncbi:hypothetical protein DN730_15580 [Marinomonas piezotolerans]|uniref:Cadherin domain-containing protein n=1 Tax=Marinomonas piezotolerans TaxID=2213058 RepID=A0A370U5S2_9GAMM|nr:Ig-like domain-containing protein [Marinomonas piezotolerans]RDL43127.1 hypothetical protein DN730_15580 [Marinomonas piezotolerans]